jgi:hypothetical protein
MAYFDHYQKIVGEDGEGSSSGRRSAAAASREAQGSSARVPSEEGSRGAVKGGQSG